MLNTRKDGAHDNHTWREVVSPPLLEGIRESAYVGGGDFRFLTALICRTKKSTILARTNECAGNHRNLSL